MDFIFIHHFFGTLYIVDCADILPRDRTPQKVTIEPIVPYANVDIFLEKGAKSFSKNV
jgi:hypothetical protein